ncbi:hypothetical protein PG989_005550 [Apiospora arundinis]
MHQWLRQATRSGNRLDGLLFQVLLSATPLHDNRRSHYGHLHPLATILLLDSTRQLLSDKNLAILITAQGEVIHFVASRFTLYLVEETQTGKCLTCVGWDMETGAQREHLGCALEDGHSQIFVHPTTGDCTGQATDAGPNDSDVHALAGG